MATQQFALLEHNVVDNGTSFILKQAQLMKRAVTVLSSSSCCALTQLSAVKQLFLQLVGPESPLGTERQGLPQPTGWLSCPKEGRLQDKQTIL